MKYFQTKEQAFETMNRLELRITELAKKTTDLTILPDDKIEYNQLKELIYQYSEGRNKVTENALGLYSYFHCLFIFFVSLLPVLQPQSSLPAHHA